MLNSLWVEVGGEDEYKPVVSKNFLLWKMEKKNYYYTSANSFVLNKLSFVLNFRGKV